MGLRHGQQEHHGPPHALLVARRDIERAEPGLLVLRQPEGAGAAAAPRTGRAGRLQDPFRLELDQQLAGSVRVRGAPAEVCREQGSHTREEARRERVRRHVHDEGAIVLGGLQIQAVALRGAFPGSLEGTQSGVFGGDEGRRQADEGGSEQEVRREHGVEGVQQLREGELVGLRGRQGLARTEQLVRELRTPGRRGEAVDDVGRALGEVAEQRVGRQDGGRWRGEGRVCGSHGCGGRRAMRGAEQRQQHRGDGRDQQQTRYHHTYIPDQICNTGQHNP